VARFTKASYIEDQDYWHLSGIHGDVSLIYKPAARINDYQIKAIPHLRGKYGTSDTGELTADVAVSRVPLFAEYTVKMSLYDAEGKCLDTIEAKPSAKTTPSAVYAPPACTARLRLTLTDITPWTTETPVLYTAVFTLLSPSGEVMDVESCRVGFKKVEVKNGVVHLNEQRLVVQGVNRHQFNYQTGRVVPVEWMRREIIEMKRMNMNAVRTSHYPCCAEWYELCDELGLLVVCEANLETHGVEGQLAQDPAWAKMFLERAVRMVQNYKNHVCIFSWSLGNESGVGANHGAMAGFIREYDGTRLCQYAEGPPSALVSDVRGFMYAPVETIYSLLTDTNDIRPIILIEFLYQIRNAGGGMYHFRELTERYARFQGGFVWDWQDKTIESTAPDGTKYFAHGGDFGESVTEWPSPKYMTNNGVVLGDLRWKPVAYEIKQAYAPVVVRPISKTVPWWPYDSNRGSFEILNRTYTKPLSDYSIVLCLIENGHEVHRQAVNGIEIAPLSKKTVALAPDYELKDDCEYFIEFRVTEKAETLCAPAGYEVGRFQYAWRAPNAVPVLQKNENGNYANVNDDGCELSLSLQNSIFLHVCKKSGALRLQSDGEVYFTAGLPCFDRPYCGMDIDWGGMTQVFALMRNGNTRIAPESVDLISGCNAIEVIFKITTKKDSREIISYVKNRYTLLPTGAVEINFQANLNEELAYVPRAGMEFILPQGFDALSYYGLGENENYSDRQMSAYMGVYESTVTHQHFPYCPPSACGSHGQARWVSFKNAEGRRLTFIGQTPFTFDALHNTVEDYQKALHNHELPAREEIYLHIDAAHSGIGSNMSWSSHLEPSLLAKAAPHYLSFTVSLR
jgi:beta-galactosidase